MSPDFDWCDRTAPRDFGEVAAETLFDHCPQTVSVQLLVAEDKLHDTLKMLKWDKWNAFASHRGGYDESKVTDAASYARWLQTFISAHPKSLGTAIATAGAVADAPAGDSGNNRYCLWSAKEFCRNKFVCIAEIHDLDKVTNTACMQHEYIHKHTYIRTYTGHRCLRTGAWVPRNV